MPTTVKLIAILSMIELVLTVQAADQGWDSTAFIPAAMDYGIMLVAAADLALQPAALQYTGAALLVMCVLKLFSCAALGLMLHTGSAPAPRPRRAPSPRPRSIAYSAPSESGPRLWVIVPIILLIIIAAALNHQPAPAPVDTPADDPVNKIQIGTSFSAVRYLLGNSERYITYRDLKTCDGYALSDSASMYICYERARTLSEVDIDSAPVIRIIRSDREYSGDSMDVFCKAACRER